LFFLNEIFIYPVLLFIAALFFINYIFAGNKREIYDHNSNHHIGFINDISFYRLNLSGKILRYDLMNAYDLIQIFIYMLILIICTPVLGRYMTRVFSGQNYKGIYALKPLEKLIYRICGIRPEHPMNWKEYTLSLLIFNFLGFIVVYILQIFQNHLPLNPQHLVNVNPVLAFNIAVSFITNTNWQSYAGETTLSYAVQMLGLTVQNFLSAATGLSVAIAFIRGIKNRSSSNIGNFWVDLIRSTVYILLPFSFLLAIFLVSQGVIQTFHGYSDIITIEGGKQIIPVGPVASQIAIKQLGTNGGGFFNANSAHPFENPTPLSNFLEMLAILVLPAALTYTYGQMLGAVRQGWSIFFAMFLLFSFGLIITLGAEFTSHPPYTPAGIMEGKELRFGITNSVLWANATTCASSGSINAMHSSLSPLTGFVLLLNIMLGEIIFGGVGSGLYGILIFIILTVFITGLLVGRTPEYLGKKIEAFEVKMAIIAVLVPAFVILVFSAVSVIVPAGLLGILNQGPHGLSEILYAFSSAAGNNGSAFAGLSANSDYYNLLTGLGMLLGRYGVIIPVLAIAGSLSSKKINPPSAGTFRSDTGLFVFMLIAIILIIGSLTFLPALTLGPVVEHFLMTAGKLF
jgi:K+-transporting ATPase ATPase A chain